MTERSAAFNAIAEQSLAMAELEGEVDREALDALSAAAEQVGRAWSKSNLGYQANVYYENYSVPPAGAIFSREWGFLGQFHGTTGRWERHTLEEVVAHIQDVAGHPDLETVRKQTDPRRPAVDEQVERARSLAAKIPPPHDSYLRGNLEELSRIALPDVDALSNAQMHTTSGQFVIRDSQALEGGWQPAGHQVVLANVAHIVSPYKVAASLAAVCGRLAMHLEDEDASAEKALVQLGNKVFLGHGGASDEYFKLGVWLSDRGLAWDAFDRKPVAGLSTKERLLEMLDDAMIAFLLMTPEDEDVAGKMNARANVIHEVGLFQGRLGWTKAVVLLEEGCEEFSNIEGIGQIRYPKGNIAAVFDEIRGVLEREGLL